MAPYVTNMLNSILDSMQTGDELIIVDDGSPDETTQICQNWLKNNHPTGVLLRQENQGVSASRNRALSHARNDYILFLDGDDELVSDTILESRAILSKINPDILEFDFYYWDPKRNSSTTPSKPKSHGANRIITSTEDILCNTLQDRAWALWGRLIKRTLFPKNCDNYFPTKLSIDDLPSTPRLAARAQSLYYLPKPIIKYRLTANSLSKQRSAMHCFDIAASTAFVLQDLQQVPQTPKMREAIQLWVARTFYESLRMGIGSPQRAPSLFTQIYLASVGNISVNKPEVIKSLLTTGSNMDKKIALEIHRFEKNLRLRGWIRYLSSKFRRN